MKKGLIGSLMVQRGLLTATQLEQAQALQRRSGGQLDEILISMEMLTESSLQRCLAEISACAYYDRATLKSLAIDSDLLLAVSYRMAMTHLLLPLHLDTSLGKLLVVAQAPLSKEIKAGLERSFQIAEIEVALCTRDDLLEAIRFHYGANLAARATQRNHAVAIAEPASDSFEEINELAMRREGFCPTCGTPCESPVGACLQCGREWEEAALDPFVDRLLGGRWKITSLLSQGGMGLIYKAIDLTSGLPVAIKLLRNQFRSSSIEIQRFNTEAQILQLLQHPQIVSTHEFGYEENLGFYLVLELLEGEDLYEYQFQLALPTLMLCEIFAQVCDAMAYAHQQGIIHRDLKPENIFLLGGAEQFQGVKIFDFGIAKLLQGHRHLTQPGIVMGTPEYIAPEQAKNGPVDHRTDIYALSVIMYEFLSGQRLFEADSAYAYLMKHVYSPVTPLSARSRRTIPLMLEQLVMQGLEKDPAHRIPSMEVFRDTLYAIIAEIEQRDEFVTHASHHSHADTQSAPSPTPVGRLGPGSQEAFAETMQVEGEAFCAQERVPTRTIYGHVSGGHGEIPPSPSLSIRASQLVATGAAGLFQMVSNVPLPIHASAYAGVPRPFAAEPPVDDLSEGWCAYDSQFPEDDPADAPTERDVLPSMLYEHATMPIEAILPAAPSHRWLGLCFAMTLLSCALMWAWLRV